MLKKFPPAIDSPAKIHYVVCNEIKKRKKQNMSKDIVKQPEIQLLFDAGALVRAIVVKAPLEEKGCNLIFEGKNKQQYVFASARKPKEPRIFKTYDGAIQMAERIGFKKVEVAL